ncbi:MAG: hypothetical protein L3J53_02795 [Proteobacteria bacterium]|nr:hypothetical protein [Pseudomonadota bacterium]
MKKILIFLAFVQIQVSLANYLPEYIVSNRDFIHVNELSAGDLPIYAGRQLYLLSNNFSCPNPITPTLYQVEVNGNSIKVLTWLKRAKKNSLVKCTPPPPRPFSYFDVADIPALASGTYHLNYYFIPSDIAFPPDESDLPDYLVTDFSFNVLAVRSIDSLSTWSLIVLTLLLFLMGHTGLKMQRRSKF